MKQFFYAFLIWASAFSSHAQTPNQPLTDASIVTLSGNGKKVTFAIAEAKLLFQQLNAELDVKKPSTSWMPPAMRERLYWLQTQAFVLSIPNFPRGWSPGQINVDGSEILAQANYCTIPSLRIQNKPCVHVYVSMLMLDLRLNYGLQPPDEKFKIAFALAMAHEAVHLELPISYFVQDQPLDTRAKEEIRTWSKVVREMAVPLQKAGKPLTEAYLHAIELLRPCNYKLPCQPFETWIRQSKFRK